MPRGTVSVRGLGGAAAIEEANPEWVEALPELVRRLELRRYFRRIANHSGAPTELTPRSFLVYMRVYVLPYIERTIELTAPVVSPTFYDHGIRIGTWRGAVRPQRAWAILVNSHFSGMYFPELESFVLSDWTHDDDDISTVAMLVEELLELTGLEPLPEAEQAQSQGLVPVEVTVGCDPEFELVEFRREGPRVVAACEVLSEPGGLGGPIGADGAGAQLELRPVPSTDPAQVVASIRALFERFARRYASYDGSPVGERYPVGGHIHIGVGKPWDPPCDVIRILDHFIGRPLRGLNGPARNESGYGGLSDIRVEPHGFEYRTPPAAIFADPRMAEITLKLARNLVSRVLNAPRGETITYHLPPYLREYVTIGGLTREEARYFAKFRRRWREYPVRSIRAAWGLGEPELGAPVIVFHDDWDSSAREAYRERLMGNATFREVASGMAVVLYGLAAERGDVATIPIEGFGVLESPPHSTRPRPSAVAIGLPRVARVHPTWRDHIDAVIEGIVNYLSQRAGDSAPARAEEQEERGWSPTYEIYVSSIDSIPSSYDSLPSSYDSPSFPPRNERDDEGPFF